MNNQFSQRVSDIITYSKEEANRLRNRYIGPEHLLLGMLRDGGGKALGKRPSGRRAFQGTTGGIDRPPSTRRCCTRFGILSGP